MCYNLVMTTIISSDQLTFRATGEGWRRAEIVLEADQSFRDDYTSTKGRMINGPALVVIDEAPDGGFNVRIRDLGKDQ